MFHSNILECNILDPSILVYIGASVFLGFLSGFLGTYIMLKNTLKSNAVMDLTEDILVNFLDKVQSDAEIQKRIYILGGILGQGIKSGVGLSGKTGKFKFEDLVGSLIGGFLQNNKLFGGQGSPGSSITSTDTELKT